MHLGRDGGLEAVDALARERADAVELRIDGARGELVAARCRDRVLAHALGQPVGDLLRAGHVDLVRHHDARARRQLVGVQRQLAVDDIVILQRIASLVVARQVHHVHDERRALDVAQELVSQTAPFVRALDEAGDVGHDEAVVPRTRHAEVRHERGERVVGDLRPRRAHLSDERRLARRRHAHEGRVGHELHLQLDPALLRRLAQLGERGRASGRRHEVDVAAAAHAALGHGDAFAVVREVGDELAHFLRFFEILVDDRAHRHLEHKVLAGGSVHARALAVRAALGFEMVFEAVFDERGQAGIGLDHNVAAVTAIAAVRTALRHMSLAAK